MLNYLAKRMIYMLIVIILISILSFVIIQLPPGDYLTSYITSLQKSGKKITQEKVESLKDRYGIDEPIYVQYFKWIFNFVQGDMGKSFQYIGVILEVPGVEPGSSRARIRVYRHSLPLIIQEHEAGRRAYVPFEPG